MFTSLSSRSRLRFLVQILLFSSALALLVPVQASEDIGYVPGFGMSYYFGGKSAGTALALSAGWQSFGMGDVVGSRGSIDLLRMNYSTRQPEMLWSVAGLSLNEGSTGGTGLSTGQKWAIGLGIAAAAVYVITDRVGDEFGDAVEDEAENAAEGAFNNPENNNEPACPTSPVCL